jgi:hypothetical protein
MPKPSRAQTILLLADGFDEAAVGIILTALRQEGLAVSLVGLRAKRVSGAHGLVIVPDTSLDRFLEVAAPIAALILPGGSNHLARLKVDPRVEVLLKRSVAEKAILVGVDRQMKKLTHSVAEMDYALSWLMPEPDQYLEQFATTIIQGLQDRKEA